MSDGKGVSYSAVALLISAFSVWLKMICFYPAPALRGFTLIDMYGLIGLLLSIATSSTRRASWRRWPAFATAGRSS
ncbi:MAG: hypothetical protein ACP5ID_05495 [Conexivisphaera sp.]